MRFDIYKRSTKQERYQAIEAESRPAPLSKQETDALLDRLVEDGRDRVLRTKIMEDLQVKHEAAKRAGGKKLSLAEGRRVYERLVEWDDEAKAKIEARRDSQRRRQEREEQQLILHRRTKSKGGDLIARVNADIERRKEKLQQARKEREESEQLEVSG